MITGRGFRKLLVKTILIPVILAGPSWLAYSYAQSCGCSNLDDIINFANTQVDASKVYVAARDKYADKDRQNRRSGQPPEPYDDSEYNKVMKDSGKAKTCPPGGKDIGASTSGANVQRKLFLEELREAAQDGVPDACMQSLVDAHEGVHQRECELGKEYNDGLITNYKNHVSMTQSMEEEVKAHKAGWKKAMDVYKSILDEWCCNASPPFKYPKTGAVIKPTLGKIVKNLLK